MSDSTSPAAPAANEQNANAKPVYLDKEKDVAVYLNTRSIKTGPKAGQSFEVYTYTEGRGPDAYRVDVPTRWSNYDLQNINTRDRQFSDVVDLVEGKELLVTVTSKPTEKHPEGSKYDVLIGGLPIVEHTYTKEDQTNGTFRRLPLVDAFVSFREEDVNRENPRFFTIDNAEGQKVLSCQRMVGPVKIFLADAVAARDAIAAGKDFSITRDGYTVPFEAIVADAKSKTPGMMRMNWGKPIAQKQSRVYGRTDRSNDAPLPERSASQGARSQTR